MKAISIVGAAALLLVSNIIGQAGVCPTYTKKTAIEGEITQIPSGIVVSAVYFKKGLYKSALGQNTPVLIPGTENDQNCNSVHISPDGKWLVYNQGGPKVIGIDGKFKTSVPGTGASGSEGAVTIWWNSPKGGDEIVYRKTGDKVVHAIGITWGANGPVFGTDRKIAEFTSSLEFSMGVAKNHMFVRINDNKYAPQFITIPDNGNGVATDANRWVMKDPPSFGCMTTLSPDGTKAVYNTGYTYWCDCVMDEACYYRHQSFVVLPFKEQTDPAISWVKDFIKLTATSINWAPAKYMFRDSLNRSSDFKNWNFTNNEDYVVGDHIGAKTVVDSGSVWLVNWKTNTWTKVLSMPGSMFGFPSVWIDKSGSVGNQRSLLNEQSTLPDGACLQDVRGRCIGTNETMPKDIAPGIYNYVAPDGSGKKVTVDR